MTARAQQGHPYLYRGARVVALESGTLVNVLHVDEAAPHRWRTSMVLANSLKPAPLRYLGNQIPEGTTCSAARP